MTVTFSIEDTLKALLQRFSLSSYPLLHDAISHTILNPGKRIRPLLVYYTVLSLQGRQETALIPACALEILHTYSLIHDDLPCMDNDDFRRGKPTLHRLYNDGQAVLAGDLLLTFAFEILTTAPSLSSEKKIELIKILAKRAGGQGMILGQSMDLFYENKQASWEQLSTLHQRKTADLISACLEFGSVVSGGSVRATQTLYEIGQEVGLAFQITDDLLEVQAGENSSDIHKNKSTSITLLGAAKAKELADTCLAKALDLCATLGLEKSPLSQFLPQLVFRTF